MWLLPQKKEKHLKRNLKDHKIIPPELSGGIIFFFITFFGLDEGIKTQLIDRIGNPDF